MADGPSLPPVLPAGGVIPYLSVTGGKAALDFYAAAFGAVELFRSYADDGERIMHARFEIDGTLIMLSDDFPESRGGAPAPAPAGVMMHIQVEDADAAWSRATAAGATVRMPLADMFWGDRYGQLTDPFGHTWSIASTKKG